MASLVKLLNPNHWLDIAVGKGTGYAAHHKFGRNPDVDTGAFEAIWNGGADYTGHDAVAAETVEVFSSDAADAAAGVGARTVQVYGLDSAWAEQSETVSLNGVTAVDTVNTYLRLDRMIVRTAGGDDNNAGAITARQKTTTVNIFAVMPAGFNQTMIAAYTIPAGKTGYLLAWGCSADRSQATSCNGRLLARPTGEVFQVKEQGSFGDGVNLQRAYRCPKGPYAAQTDLKVMVDSSANNVAIMGYLDLILG